MSLSYCLIVNRKSNSGRALRKIEKSRNEILKKLVDVEIYILKKNESISEVTKEKAMHFDVIVACGGDGTARNVAIGLKDTGKVFGLLPLGTGNDFAKMLNLDTDICKNLDVLKKGAHTTFDLISYNQHFFINTLGIGFDGLTNHIASKIKLLKGSSKYMLAGLKALLKFKPFNAQIVCNKTKKDFLTPMIIVANGKWEGGKYLVSRKSINNDGVIELIILKNIAKIRLLIEFIRLSFGKPLSKDLADILTSTSFLINTSEPVLFHVDGEVENPNQNFHIEVIPEQINAIFREF